MNRTWIVAGMALGAALALPSAASAQTSLFTEDAEGAIEAKWIVGPAPDKVEPWQKSDSSAQKYRGNQAHGGATSFWSGMSPSNWPLIPTTLPAGATVVEGESILTMKEPLVVPADGETTLKYFSLFQNEGDDQGISQVAPLGADGKPGTWKNLKSETATATSAGDNDPRACDPSRPDKTNSVPFSEMSASLGTYKGLKVLVRFVLKYGAENRPVSHPCGWYLDDVSVLTTGTPGQASGGDGTPATGGGTTTPAPAAEPSVKFRSLKGKGKTAKLALTISGSGLTDATLTLLKGKRKVGAAKAATLGAGTRTVVFKLKKKLAKGSYVVRLTGKDADGGSFAKTGKVKGR